MTDIPRRAVSRSARLAALPSGLAGRRPSGWASRYPGAGAALLADLKQLGRLAGLFRVVQPGLDVKPLVTELRARIVEELDYELEAEAQRTFAAAYADDEMIYVPPVIESAPQVLVTEWIDGTPMSRIIASGSEQERDLA